MIEETYSLHLSHTASKVSSCNTSETLDVLHFGHNFIMEGILRKNNLNYLVKIRFELANLVILSNVNKVITEDKCNNFANYSMKQGKKPIKSEILADLNISPEEYFHLIRRHNAAA